VYCPVCEEEEWSHGKYKSSVRCEECFGWEMSWCDKQYDRKHAVRRYPCGGLTVCGKPVDGSFWRRTDVQARGKCTTCKGDAKERCKDCVTTGNVQKGCDACGGMGVEPR
jgi:hypothetical protein